MTMTEPRNDSCICIYMCVCVCVCMCVYVCVCVCVCVCMCVYVRTHSRPYQHGGDMLAAITLTLSQCTRPDMATPAALALQGLQELCRAEVKHTHTHTTSVLHSSKQGQIIVWGVFCRWWTSCQHGELLVLSWAVTLVHWWSKASLNFWLWFLSSSSSQRTMRYQIHFITASICLQLGCSCFYFFQSVCSFGSLQWWYQKASSCLPKSQGRPHSSPHHPIRKEHLLHHTVQQCRKWASKTLPLQGAQLLLWEGVQWSSRGCGQCRGCCPKPGSFAPRQLQFERLPLQAPSPH